MQYIYILLTGTLSGIFGTMLGLGGGVLTVPILIFILNMNVHQAISLSLVSIIAKSIFSTSINFKYNYINFSLGLLLIPFAIIGSTLGGKIGFNSSDFFIKIFFSASLLLASVMVYLNRKKTKIEYIEGHFLSGSYNDKDKKIQYTPKNYIVAMMLSSFAGFFAAIVGIGGGSIFVPIMRLVNKIPIKAATSTSIFIMGLSTMMPAFYYYKKGVLMPDLAVFIIFGSYIGAYIGNILLRHIRDKHISKIFAGVLISISLLTIYKTIRG